MYNNTITKSQMSHTFLLDRNRERKIVFYGRVSTEHEAQLAALEKADLKPRLPTHYYLNGEDGLEMPSIILLEQIRTIDKRRLDGYIGHLSKEHIAGMDHALAVSIDLIEQVPNKLVMCLCHTCAKSFRSTGNNYLRQIDPYQVERNTCTYCNRRLGHDYELMPKKIGGVQP